MYAYIDGSVHHTYIPLNMSVYMSVWMEHDVRSKSIDAVFGVVRPAPSFHHISVPHYRYQEIVEKPSMRCFGMLFPTRSTLPSVLVAAWVG